MSRSDAARQEEWDRLRAERAVARRELVAAVAAIEVRARDPFGLKDKIRRHPALAAGVAAGAGAILVHLLVPHGPRRPAAESEEEGDSDRSGPSWADSLRDAALRVATPWLARFVSERLGVHVDADADADEDDSPRRAA